MVATVARKTPVKNGTTFSVNHADSMSLFTVVAARGADTYDCEVKPHPQHGTMIDWLGTKKVFGGEEIRRAIATAKLFSRLDQNAKSFWASRKVGEIVHYHNGFGQYVRGEIVRVGREMKMKPTALVGNWTHELPKRRPDGTVNYSHHVKRIRFPDADAVFQPNDSCMWESDSFSKPMGPFRDFDPTTATPIDLSDPAPLEGAAAEAARLEKLRMDAGTILGQGYQNPAEALAIVAKMLKDAGIQ